MSKFSVSSTALNGAALLVQSYGVDPDLLARLAGVDAASLGRMNTRVPLNALLRFLNMAATACKEPQFGIELACRQGLEVLGPVWVLARHAETMAGSLESICQSLDLHSNALSLSIRNQAEGALVNYHIQADNPADSNNSDLQAVEQSLALLCNEIRVVAGPAWQPRYVQFRHDAPANLAKHHTVFGRALHFNQDRNALFLNRDTLDLRINASADGHRIIQQHLRLLQHMGGESFATRVTQIVSNLLTSEGCSAQAVAQALGLNLRTLQHRLARADTSYQVILDDARANLGQSYLRNSRLSVAEIAELLKFSEGSAFSRFFRQHTGMTPREYQRRQQNDVQENLAGNT